MLPAMMSWLAASMALLVSPDHLRLWGNLAGHIGTGFWIVAAGAAALFALSVASYRRLEISAAGAGGYLAALKEHGGGTAIALALTGRLALTIGLSTGILATSGFVFNETFVYWFPNFGFAFLYLAAVALVLCRGYGLAERIMTGLVAITLAGLMVLVLAGFLQTGQPPTPDDRPPSGFGAGTVFSGLLLFVGFDLGIHRREHLRGTGAATKMMLAALGMTVVLLSMWGAVSLAHVPAPRLAETFIPYTLAARQIGGQAGRILMGIVLIAGTGCAVISLFSTSARMVTSLAHMDMLPRFCRGSARRNLWATLVLAFAVAAMMAAGAAGAPELEVFIRAAFVLWLLHIILVHLAALKARVAKTSAAFRRITWLTVPSAALTGAGMVYLWVTDDRRALLSTCIFALWSGGAMLLFVVRLAKGRKTSPAV
ncbi:hypothetical protein DSCA_64430 [Desulfosarcina alkanivorans]|jgi:amino acid transporter|uniref:Amino acid permease n=1 Tax=Desulfosarcina alkanivorans TaxID=571177 RepID=A0A5K7YX24_9BACT|nr:amino acid permease [Desulfosarcina alkanivorans]BBO72513.1 hypothetical protein DSCA_64430 [Desulfosarcina alkanivorans]